MPASLVWRLSAALGAGAPASCLEPALGARALLSPGPDQPSRLRARSSVSESRQERTGRANTSKPPREGRSGLGALLGSALCSQCRQLPGPPQISPQPSSDSEALPPHCCSKASRPLGAFMEKQARGLAQPPGLTPQMSQEVLGGIIGGCSPREGQGVVGAVIKAEHGLPAPREQCPGPCPRGRLSGARILRGSGKTVAGD